MRPDQRPALLGDDVIAELRQRERGDGLIPGPTAKRRLYRPGAVIRVRQGALSGLQGKINSMLDGGSGDRLRVLFDLLGRQTPVEMSETEIALAVA